MNKDDVMICSWRLARNILYSSGISCNKGVVWRVVMFSKDMFRLLDFFYLIEDIIKLKEKYGIDKRKMIRIDNIAIRDEMLRYDIYVNDNPWVSLDKGLLASLRLCAAIPFKGSVKGPFRFLTTNTSAQSEEFVSGVYKRIKEGLPKLEEEYKEISNRTWKL